MNILRYTDIEITRPLSAAGDFQLDELWKHNDILKNEKGYWTTALTSNQEEINCFDLSNQEVYADNVFLQDLMQRKLELRNTISRIDFHLSIIFNGIDFLSLPIQEGFSSRDNLIKDIIEFYQKLISLNKKEEAYVTNAATYCSKELSELLTEIVIRTNEMIQATIDFEYGKSEILTYDNFQPQAEFSLILCPFCGHPNIVETNWLEIICTECGRVVTLEDVN